MTTTRGVKRNDRGSIMIRSAAITLGSGINFGSGSMNGRSRGVADDRYYG